MGDKPDEENKEAESGKDGGEGDEDQVTKMFRRRWEEENLNTNIMFTFFYLHNIMFVLRRRK